MVDEIILWQLFKFRQVPLYWIKKRDLSQAKGAERSLLGVGPGYWRLLWLPRTPPSASTVCPGLTPAPLPGPCPHATALHVLFSMLLHQLAEGREKSADVGAKRAMEWSWSPSSSRKPHTGVMQSPGNCHRTQSGLPRKGVRGVSP